MKFLSKNLNYTLVLKSGFPGNRATGAQPIPGLYIRFKDGIADVKNEDITQMMMEHGSYGNDFVCIDDKDYQLKKSVSGTEPTHVITEMQYGVLGKSTGSLIDRQGMTEEMKKSIAEMAKDMAKDMAKEIIKEYIDNQKETKSPEVKSVKVSHKAKKIKNEKKIENLVVEPSTNNSEQKEEDDIFSSL